MWRLAIKNEDPESSSDDSLSQMSSLLASKVISDIWKPLQPTSPFPIKNDPYASSTAYHYSYHRESSGYGSDDSPRATGAGPFDNSFHSNIQKFQRFNLSSFDDLSSSFHMLPYELLTNSNYSTSPGSPMSVGSPPIFDFSMPSSYEDLRNDFDSNGKTVDIKENFFPSASSTPFFPRKNTTSETEADDSTSSSLPTNSNSGSRTSSQSSYNKTRKPKKKFKPNKKSLQDHCVFCKNNGSSPAQYNSHTVKDAVGRTVCPILRRYKCQICGRDGDFAHTVKYCPDRPIITYDDVKKMEKSNQKFL